MCRQSSKRVIPSQRPRPASLAAKGPLVIARNQCRTSAHTGVGEGIRFPVEMSVNIRLSGNTDCHTSDIGHWFAMTETDFFDSLMCRFFRRVLLRKKRCGSFDPQRFFRLSFFILSRLPCRRPEPPCCPRGSGPCARPARCGWPRSSCRCRRPRWPPSERPEWRRSRPWGS